MTSFLTRVLDDREVEDVDRDRDTPFDCLEALGTANATVDCFVGVVLRCLRRGAAFVATGVVVVVDVSGSRLWNDLGSLRSIPLSLGDRTPGVIPILGLNLRPSMIYWFTPSCRKNAS